MADEPGTDPAPEGNPPEGQTDKTFTQEDLDRKIGERLAREREKYADYDELKGAAQRLAELEAENQSELEKAQTKASKIEKERDEAKAQLLRFEVAKEKEVPAEAVDFLKGKSREELEASAEKLLELVKSRTENEPDPDFDGGPREPTQDPKTPEAAHNDLAVALFGSPRT